MWETVSVQGAQPSVSDQKWRWWWQKQCGCVEDNSTCQLWHAAHISFWLILHWTLKWSLVNLPRLKGTGMCGGWRTRTTHIHKLFVICFIHTHCKLFFCCFYLSVKFSIWTDAGGWCQQLNALLPFLRLGFLLDLLFAPLVHHVRDDRFEHLAQQLCHDQQWCQMLKVGERVGGRKQYAHTYIRKVLFAIISISHRQSLLFVGFCFCRFLFPRCVLMNPSKVSQYSRFSVVSNLADRKPHKRAKGSSWRNQTEMRMRGVFEPSNVPHKSVDQHRGIFTEYLQPAISQWDDYRTRTEVCDFLKHKKKEISELWTVLDISLQTEKNHYMSLHFFFFFLKKKRVVSVEAAASSFTGSGGGVSRRQCGGGAW